MGGIKISVGLINGKREVIFLVSSDFTTSPKLIFVKVRLCMSGVLAGLEVVGVEVLDFSVEPHSEGLYY